MQHGPALKQATSSKTCTSAMPMLKVLGSAGIRRDLNKISKLPLRQGEAPLIAGDDSSEVVGLCCCSIKAYPPIWALP